MSGAESDVNTSFACILDYTGHLHAVMGCMGGDAPFTDSKFTLAWYTKHGPPYMVGMPGSI